MKMNNTHKQFYKEHRHVFILMDILMVLSILMNFGALVLTNIMVMEKNYDIAEQTNTKIIYTEISEPTAKLHNLKTIADYDMPEEELKVRESNRIRILTSIVKQALIWSIMLFLYIYLRVTARNYFTLGCLILGTSLYFCFLGYDFFHDLGLFISSIMYG